MSDYLNLNTLYESANNHQLRRRVYAQAFPFFNIAKEQDRGILHVPHLFEMYDKY